MGKKHGAAEAEPAAGDARLAQVEARLDGLKRDIQALESRVDSALEARGQDQESQVDSSLRAQREHFERRVLELTLNGDGDSDKIERELRTLTERHSKDHDFLTGALQRALELITALQSEVADLRRSHELDVETARIIREHRDAAVPALAPVAESQDLNEMTFEQLCAIGLSATQARRVLARRDELGGFGSVAELDQLIGFPESILDALKHRVRV